MKSFIFLILFLFLNLISCKYSNAPINRINQFEKLSNLASEGNRIYLFMPLDGCNSCIDETFKFISKNDFREKLFLIISDYRVKLARTKINKRLDSHCPILIDSTGLASHLHLLYNSPVVYFIDQGVNLVDSMEINLNTKDSVFKAILIFSIKQ